MMKKILYFLPILAVLLSSCSQKNELTGTLTSPDCNGKQVYLLTMKDFDSPFLPTDSTVIENGHFHFKLNDSTPVGVGYILIKDAPASIPNGIPFVYEKGGIDVKIDSVARVTGTPLNDKSQAFYDELSVVAKKADAIGEKMSNDQDDSNRQQLFKELMDVNKEASGVIFKFVKNNIDNKVGEFYFIHFSQAFDESQVNELLESATPEFKTKVETLFRGEAQAESKFVGKDFINISGETPDGKTVSLADYVGKNKLVLVDFWASWCGPCRVEMPNLVEAYAQYKNKGFEIVGVSLDENKADWEKGIKELNITWPQMSDLKGWDSKLSGAYQVTSIPFTILINQEGKIVAENLREDELIQALGQILQ